MKMQKSLIFVNKIETKHLKDKKHRKVKDHYRYIGEYRGAAHNICNLKQSVPSEISYGF